MNSQNMTGDWEIMSKESMRRAVAETMNKRTSEMSRMAWTVFAMTGIPSFLAGVGKMYRVRNLQNGQRKNVFSGNDYTVGTKIAEVDWEFEVTLNTE